MQSLYSFFLNEKSDLNKHITFFEESFLNNFSLYITILSFLKSVHEYAQQHILLQKELRNGPSDNKSRHLVNNKILSFISVHRVLTGIIKEKKIKFLLFYLKKFSLKVFVYYRIILAVILLLISYG